MCIGATVQAAGVSVEVAAVIKAAARRRALLAKADHHLLQMEKEEKQETPQEQLQEQQQPQLEQQEQTQLQQQEQQQQQQQSVHGVIPGINPNPPTTMPSPPTGGSTLTPPSGTEQPNPTPPTPPPIGTPPPPSQPPTPPPPPPCNPAKEKCPPSPPPPCPPGKVCVRVPPCPPGKVCIPERCPPGFRFGSHGCERDQCPHYIHFEHGVCVKVVHRDHEHERIRTEVQTIIRNFIIYQNPAPRGQPSFLLLLSTAQQQ